MRDTPSKTAEESERRYTSPFRQNPDGVYSLDRRGKVVAVNPAMTTLLGFGASELIGKNAAMLIVPEDRRQAATRFAEVVDGEPQNYQLTVRRKDGSMLKLDVTQVPITSGGEVVGIHGIAHGIAKDVTQARRAEEELGRSEERYRLVALATNEAIWDNDLLTGEQRWAGATEALFGYPPYEGRTGTWWEERIHPDDKGRVLSGLAALLAEGGEMWVEEYRFRRADGSYAHVADRGYAVHDGATGRVVRMVGSMTDITDRRETEIRLREAEARYRNVAESLGEGLLITDLEDTVLYANPRMAELSGYAVEEMLGKAGYKLLLPQEQWAEVRRRNEKRARGMAERYETQLRRMDGTRFWAAVSAAPYRDPSGEIVGTVGAFSDVTERKAAEEDLRRSERNLAEAQRIAHVGHWEHDLVEGEIHWSDELFHIFGLAPGAIKPTWKAFLGHVHPEDRSHVRDAYVEALRDGGSDNTKYRAVRPDGEVRIVHNRREVFLSGEGKPVRVAGTVQDVTERERAERRLREAEERYRTLVEQIPAVTYIDRATDGTDEPLYTSPQIEGMLGYTPEEWLEGPLWPERLHPDDRERVLAADERFEAGGEPFSEEYRLLAKDGSVVWVREEAVLVRNDAGEPMYWQGIITEVTEHKEAEEALRESEARYRALVERTPVVTYTEVVVEGISVSTYVSPQVEGLLGYKPDQLNGSPPFWQVRIHSRDRERVLALDDQANRTGEPFDVEYRMIRKGGDVIWVKDEAVLVSRDEDGTQHWQGVIHDITERKALEERLSRQALRDPLTQLANRSLFVDRVEHALARTERQGGKVAVLFLDLDDFKYVNDSLGHEAGDKMLVRVADRLRGCLRPEDTVARLGGDEFVVLLEDIEGEPDVVRLAGRIEERLREPFVIDGQEVFLTVSIGLAIGSGTEDRPEYLLRDSDLAMYRAKRSGKDHSLVFRSEMKEGTSRRLDLVGDLRQALRRPQEEFRVRYQAQVSLETGEIVGTEALIRWNHPSRGLILPSEFVPLAEETGLMVPLGWWVLREACRQTREWRTQYSTNVSLSVSVNLSGRQFQTFGLTERIRGILAETGLAPSGLVLEITESALMEDIPSTIAALRWLKDLGVGLAIDDFGTGYSSLSYIKRFPTDTIKIERSMVSGLDHDPGNAAIVSAMVTLAHALGLKVVAEGVETKAEAHELRNLGCDLGQGYYWCKPAPADEMTALLDAASRPKRRFGRRR